MQLFASKKTIAAANLKPIYCPQSTKNGQKSEKNMIQSSEIRGAGFRTQTYLPRYMRNNKLNQVHSNKDVQQPITNELHPAHLSKPAKRKLKKGSMPKKQPVNLIHINNCPFFRKKPEISLAASNRYINIMSRSHSGDKYRKSGEKIEIRKKDEMSSSDQERPGNDQVESRSDDLLLDFGSGASNTLAGEPAPDAKPGDCPIHATPVNSLAQSGQLPNQQGQQPFKTLQNSPTLINNLMSSSDNDSILNVIKNELNGCNVSPFNFDEEKEKSRTQKLPVLKITKIGALANQIKSN